MSRIYQMHIVWRRQGVEKMQLLREGAGIIRLPDKIFRNSSGRLNGHLQPSVVLECKHISDIKEALNNKRPSKRMERGDQPCGETTQPVVERAEPT